MKDEKEKDGMKYYECEIDGQKKTVYSVKGMGATTSDDVSFLIGGN